MWEESRVVERYEGDVDVEQRETGLPAQLFASDVWNEKEEIKHEFRNDVDVTSHTLAKFMDPTIETQKPVRITSQCSPVIEPF